MAVSSHGVLIPAQLFVGQQDLLLEKTEYFLQEHFCKNKEQQNLQSCFCNQCRKIKSQQHESVVFINPQKDYTVKDIEVIFEKTNLALDQDQKFFFILQKANTFNLTCANRLLKVLEEPPNGYNFILHTNNTNAILPTILSRCHIVNFVDRNENFEELNSEFSSLTTFFYKQDLDNPTEFEKELRKLHLTDNQSIEIANSMISYFAQKMIECYKNTNQKLKDSKNLSENSRSHPSTSSGRTDLDLKNKPFVVSLSNHTNVKNNFQISSKLEQFKTIHEYLKKKMRKPPQSGSSNLFWKNLYLSFPRK